MMIAFAIVGWILVAAWVLMLTNGIGPRLYGALNLVFCLILATYFTARVFGMSAPF